MEAWEELELGNTEPLPSPGIPGGSARREHERRKANRERQVREKHPYLAPLLLALNQPSADERAWSSRAEGEQRVAASFAKHCGERVVILHDRCMPASAANIDHLAIAPSGVWVIEAEAQRGIVTVENPFLAPPELLIDGRDQTTLVNDLRCQVKVVRRLVAELDPNVAVGGVLCFAYAELPAIGTLRITGLPMLRPKNLARRLNSAGSISREHAELLASQLADRLPPA